jgi:ornithine carbamoyltransferase
MSRQIRRLKIEGEKMQGKDLLSTADLTAEDIQKLIEDAINMKGRSGEVQLRGKVLALLFEKPSLRTRVSFDVAMHQLGGHTIYLSPDEVGLGKRESVADVSRVLSRYVDIIAARTFSHANLKMLAHHATIPIINALSDLEHPCQALGDLLTIYEKKGKIRGLNIAFIGDGNNVASSLLLAATLMGMNFSIASPPGYDLPEETLSQARELASHSGAQILCLREPISAVREADVVYTDVWTSMGQEDEFERRRLAFANYQVNTSLLESAHEDALFMHPLPAHRNEEVSEEVLEHKQSVVFDQAENRLHIQKAILLKLLGNSILR